MNEPGNISGRLCEWCDKPSVISYDLKYPSNMYIHACYKHKRIAEITVEKFKLGKRKLR